MMEGSNNQMAAPTKEPGKEPMPPMMIMAMNWIAKLMLNASEVTLDR